MRKSLLVLLAALATAVLPACQKAESPGAATAPAVAAKEHKVGVLLINHGSRQKAWRDQLLDVEAKVKDRLLSLPATLWHGAVRIMIEMNAGTLDRAMPVARRILDRLRQEAPDLPILLHGFDATAWDFVAAARDLGCDARIGLEDCLYLPDGRVAGNGALVAAAARTLGLDA